jgi:hypothetical protein
MTEPEMEELSTGVVGIHLTRPTGASGPALDKTPESTSANNGPPNKPLEEDCAYDIPSLTSSKVAQLSRVDSHEEGADGITFFKSHLAQAQEELRQIKMELHEARSQNKNLRQRVEVLKALPNPEDQLKALEAQIRVHEGKERESASERRRLSDDKRLLEEQFEWSQAELKEIIARKTDLEQRDNEWQRKLDGRDSMIPDDMYFEVSWGANLLRKITLSRVFTFTKRYNSASELVPDYAAIGCVRLGGRLYNAKSGRTREDFGDFINSDHWTSEAQYLAEQVGFTTDRNGATHVEPQLMAFYITRTLEETGHKLVDFSNASKFPVKEDSAKLNKIIINVSQSVCERCRAFTIIINGFAKNHGYEFEPTNNARKAGVGNGQCPGPPQRVTFISE